jgi:hypothetical protein
MKYIILLILLSSCGSAHHLRRAERLDARKQEQIQKAIAKGAKVKRDTTFKTVTFKVPGVKVEFTPKVLHDKSQPLIFIKDSVITKVVFRQGINGKDTVFVATDCPDAEVSEQVPVAINTDIDAKQNWKTMEVIGYIFMALIIGAGGMYLLKLFKVVP